MLTLPPRPFVRRPSAAAERGPRPPRRGRHAYRPEVEALEPRRTPSFTLAPQQTFAAGSEPEAVAVADVNGDGHPDLVVTNFNNTVSVLLNTTPAGSGTASFAPQQTFAVGTAPFAVAVADVNGDGRPDLIVANSEGNTVSVLLDTTAAGAAAATFAPQQTFFAGAGLVGVVAADFNGDGRPDIAVAPAEGTGLVVLLNTTAPGSATATFALAQGFDLGTNPHGMAAADVNGDGRPDLIATNGGSTVSVLLNTTAPGSGTATFAPPQTFAVGGAPVSVTAADVNGDGRPDLIVSNSGNTVSVLLNTTAAGSAATFAPQQTFAVGNGPSGVAAADVSSDGRPDLAVANNGGTVSVLLDTTTPFATTTPVEVAQFGSTGVWQFNRATGAFVQLTPANATLLAADPQGDVVGEFPGFGLQLYRPAAGWKQLNGTDATRLAMDAQGDVVAEFPGFGVGEFFLSGQAHALTPVDASLLAMDAHGDVAGVFPGYGVQLFRPTVGWQQINGVDATLLAMDAGGDIVANFKGVGVGEYLPATGWKLLNGTQATALAINALGEVVANFMGMGVGEYQPATGWRLFLPANAALLALDGNGDVFSQFVGYGLWELDPFQSGKQLRAADASLLVVA